MSLFAIAKAYVWNRRWITLLTVISILLGMSLIAVVITIRSETEAAFAQQGRAFDLVVGAKGSPLQIVLNTLYHVGIPTGNIQLTDYQTLCNEPNIAAAYPMNLGDNFRGFRIVGTTRDFLTQEAGSPTEKRSRRGRKTKTAAEPGRPMFELAEGRLFEKDFEVVAGWLAARQTGLTLDSAFVGAHGLAAAAAGGENVHHEFQYKIVGVLKPTGAAGDRALFTTMESVWHVHEPHPEGEEAHKEQERKEEHKEDVEGREVTAVLVKLTSAMWRAQMLRKINEEYNAMAAVPVEEIKGLYDRLLNPIQGALLALGYVVVVVAASSVLISLYFSTVQRQRDLALMRVLGARPWELFVIICIEAFIVGVIGVAAGIVVGHGITAGVARHLLINYGLHIRAFVFSLAEGTAALIVLALGLVAALAPAALAYRTDVARNLVGG
ncbi:MAG: ABC transporter permease [Planctomycetota bacterium]